MLLTELVITFLSLSHSWRSDAAHTSHHWYQNVWEDDQEFQMEDLFTLVWKQVLYYNSHKCNHLCHCLGYDWREHLKYASKHWLTLSVLPSDWEWYPQLIFSWVLESQKSSWHKWLMKIRSRSITIDFRRSWMKLIYMCMYAWATVGSKRMHQC